MVLFRAREQEPEVIVTAEESGALDWRKARARNFGQASGVAKQQSLFWARLSDIEYVPLLDVVEKALEAHGWELNLENLLFALGTARIGRKAQGVGPGGSGRPVAYEPVYTIELPKKGRSGRLLRLLYAALDPSNKGSKAARPESVLNRDRKLAEQNAKLEQEKARLQAEVGRLQAAIASSNLEIARMAERAVSNLESKQAAALARQEARSVPVASASPELKLAVLEIRDIDFDQRLVRLRGDGRSFEVSFDRLVLFPEKGCHAVGVFEKKTLVRLVPVGIGWLEYRYHAAKVLAATGKRAKFVTGSRFEFLMENDDFSEGRQSRLRRGDEVVCRFAGGRPIGICLTETETHLDAERRAKLHFEEAVQGQVRRSESARATRKGKD